MEALGVLLSLSAGALGLCLSALLCLWVGRPRTNVPGPATLPLLGNVLFFKKLPVIAHHFNQLQRLYGSVYRFYIGPTLMIHVTEPEDAKKILAGRSIRNRGPFVTRPLRNFPGNGLVTSSGEIWKAHRKIIAQCFHSEVLKQFMDAYNEGARYACGRLEAAAAAGGAVELYEPFCQVALRTVAASSMGLPFEQAEPDPGRQHQIASAFLSALSIIQKRVFQPWMHFEWLDSFTSDCKLLQQHKNTINSLLRRGIAIKKDMKGTADAQKKRALTDTLLGPDAQMTEQEVFDEICTIMAAGTDSTACTLSFVLCLVALYPEWQSAAQQELDDVFGTGGDYLRPCTIDDLARLQVIDSIIKETLRLYPSVPIPVVHLTEDTPLAGGRYVAPSGSYVSVALFLLHRQPHSFPDPERFNPGRFSGHDDACARHPYSYLPFGAGPRRCVGARFAVLEVKTVLAAVLRRFRVLPVSTREELDNFAVSTICQPVSGYRIICVHRENLSCKAK